MRITPYEELRHRCTALQQCLNEMDLDAALLVQNSDLFYFTGSIQRGACYVPRDGDPLYLVIKEVSRARMESGLRQVLPISGMRDLPKTLQEQGMSAPGRIGLELDVLPVQLYRRYQRLFPDAEIFDVSPAVRQVRAVKSPYELTIMRDCATLADKVYRHAAEVIEAGVTDLEIAAELECFARKEGHQGIIRFRSFNSELYFGHVFSGSDAAVPAYLDAPLGGLGLNPAVGQGASYKTVAAGEPIIIDFIMAFDGYLVDQTRTLSIGALPDRLQQAYRDMQTIQNRLCELARPGATWGSLYRSCCELADKLGYRDYFMGGAGAQVSFIGHGIGIEVDEYPFIARGFDEQVLEENMTFAFEPKAVFKGVGAVGVENTWQVVADGIRSLTRSSEELWEL